MKSFDGLVTCSAAQHLSYGLADSLDTTLLPVVVQFHPDGELSVTVNDIVKGAHLLLLASFPRPIHANIIEFTLVRDALIRHGVGSLTAVITYMAYARQDRIDQPGRPISLSAIADIVSHPIFDGLHIVEIHNQETLSLFTPEAHHISALTPIADHIRKHASGLSAPAVVSPDAGRWPYVKEIGEKLDLPTLYLRKKRLSDREVVTELTEEVKGLDIIFVDDMISTGGSLARASQTVLDKGAKSVHCAAVHGVFSEHAETRLYTAGIRHVAVSNSIATGFSQIDLTETLAEHLSR